MMARSTPTSIKRKLRQEAGFGCCVCGYPILQYHHIVEWADEEHFRPEDMMVLCPNHHDQATRGAMPEGEQRKSKMAPYNITRGLAKGLLEVKQDYCAANFGSVTVVSEGTFLQVDGEDILGFHIADNVLEISMRLYNEHDELMLEIDRNEWVSGDPLPWDVQASWQTLILRERERKISVSIDAKKIPIEILGQFWRSGKLISLNEKGIHIGPQNFSIQELALVGMSLEVATGTTRLALPPENPHLAIISWPSRRERLWRARDAWRKIVAARTAPGAGS